MYVLANTICYMLIFIQDRYTHGLVLFLFMFSFIFVEVNEDLSALFVFFVYNQSTHIYFVFL